MKRASIMFALAATLTAAGCASSGGGGRSMSSPITAEDLVPGRYSSVMDAIVKLRPGWMNRVAGIFVEGHEVDEQTLQLEAIDGIAEIGLLRCEQAMMKFPVSCVSQTYLEITRRRR